MGNTCVGPTSRVGFFDSVSAVVFRSRPPPCDQLPASSSSNPNPDSNLNPSTNGKDQAPHEAPRQVQIPELPSPEQTAKNADHYSPSAQHQHYSPKQDQDQKPGQKHTKTASVAGLATSSVLNRQTPKLKDLFSLGRKLGQGQFGTTYLCIEKSSGKEFACKSIAKRKLISQEDVEDVIREIQIMHHLAGNEHIIEIIGAFEDNVAVHLVMELCAGGELFDRIIERGHYSEKKAAELARVIVGVVEACHSLGVMHRDLKPENFLFVNRSEDSKLKTIDFGLSIFFKPGV